MPKKARKLIAGCGRLLNLKVRQAAPCQLPLGPVAWPRDVQCIVHLPLPRTVCTKGPTTPPHPFNASRQSIYASSWTRALESAPVFMGYSVVTSQSFHKIRDHYPIGHADTMEPPAKRSRIGSSPFDRKEADDDELNLRPEEVNARRDPGLQLQKSRAFAAFKLKSAFERIFEKYEKDFTGIGDEVDLRTGEIVVDNGHIQSLKESTIGADGDEDDDMSVDEEERILQGKPDNRLKLLGHAPLPPTLHPCPPAFQRAWPGATQFMGAPPLLSNVIYPGQIQVGNYPMPMSFGGSSPFQSLEPAWMAPDLPPLMFGNGYDFNAPAKLLPLTKVKVPLLTARADVDDEDDILLGVSTAADGAAGGNPGTAASVSPQQLSKEISGRIDGTVARPEAATKPGPAPAQKAARQARYRIPEISTKDNKKKGKKQDSSGSSGAAGKHRKPAKTSKSTTHKKEPEKYTNPLPDERQATKPTTQKLRVEIKAMRPDDLSSYMVVTPETTPEPEAPRSIQAERRVEILPEDIVLDEIAGDMVLDKVPDIPTVQDQPLDKEASGTTEQIDSGRVQIAELDHQPNSGQIEVFSRNTQDPTYAFSDEDEPTIPRKEASHHRRPGGPGYAIIVAQDWTALKTATSGDLELSPAPAPRKRTKSLAASLELAIPTGLDIQPQAMSVEPRLAHEIPVPRHSAQQNTPDSGEGAITEAPSLLKMKPRRSGIRKSLINFDDTFVTQPIYHSPAELPHEAELNAAAEQAALNNQKREGLPDTVANERIPSAELVPPVAASKNIPYERTIPETPEPSPEPQEFRRQPQREPSPDLGMSSPGGGSPFSNEEMASVSNVDDSIDDEPTTDRQNAEASLAVDAAQPPKTPSQKTLRRLSRPSEGSSARTGIMSLVSDDEDELSLGPEDFTPSGSRRRKSSPGDKATHNDVTNKSIRRVRGYLDSSAPSSVRSGKSTRTKRGAILGSSNSKVQMRTPPSRGRFGSVILSKFFSAGNISKLAIRNGGAGEGPGSLMRSGAAARPASRLGSELIQTPGGSMRRCGEGDFRCDRDFCFVCL